MRQFIYTASTSPTGGRVPVLCLGKGSGRAHVGAYLVNSDTWGVDVRKYNVGFHPCYNSGGWCTIASVLRAVALAVKNTAKGSTLAIGVTNAEVTRLVREWRSDATNLPVWCKGAGNEDIKQLAAKTVTSPNLFTIRTTTTVGTLEGHVGRQLLKLLLTAARGEDEEMKTTLKVNVPLVTAKLTSI